MNLILNKWQTSDIENFQKFLLTFSKGKEKSIWEQKIINTNLPCVAIPSIKINLIVKEILKGNYLGFIDLWIWENHSNTIIIGKLINHIKDFNTYKKYLLKFSEFVDNWASCDVIKPKINKNNKNEFWELSQKLIKSKKTFQRRIGLKIMFEFIYDDEFLDKIFLVLDGLQNEKEYYVNMIGAWLLCECFIKQKEKTIEYYNKSKTNNFIINKSIQKCRDSFRVSDKDKNMLLNFKCK